MALHRNLSTTAQIQPKIEIKSTAQVSTDRKDTQTIEHKAIAETKFDLSELKEFNRALVYAFQPEGSVFGDSSLDYAQHMTGQHADVLDAYLYAQNEILPTIEKSGISNISSEQLLYWINQIHLRIAKTMAENYSLSQIKFKSGEYTTEGILRWHAGKKMQIIFFEIVQKLAERQATDGEILGTAYLILKHNPELNTSGIAQEQRANEIRDFLKILLKLHNTQVKIPERLLLTLQSTREHDQHKFFFYYHQNGFNTQEKTVIEKFVKFGSLPSNIRIAMATYSKELLKKWAQCDKNNRKEIAKLASFAFYGLVNIHPWFNANGRAATCVQNVVLRSFKKPSILLRYPGEKENSNSLYSRAIAQVDTDSSLLQELIETRIKEAEEKPYQNKLQEQVLQARLSVFNLLNLIKKEFPDYDLVLAFENNQIKMKSLIDALINEKPIDEIGLICLTETIKTFEVILQKLRLGKLLSQHPGEGIVARLSLLKGENLGVATLSREMESQVTEIQKTIAF